MVEMDGGFPWPALRKEGYNSTECHRWLKPLHVGLRALHEMTYRRQNDIEALSWAYDNHLVTENR